MPIVLLRKLNHRNIELHHGTRGETVGVLMRNGQYHHVPWLGFVSAAEARQLPRARPVKLKIARIGKIKEINTQWQDVPRGKHVQGCLTQQGVYAIVNMDVRVV